MIIWFDLPVTDWELFHSYHDRMKVSLTLDGKPYTSLGYNPDLLPSFGEVRSQAVILEMFKPQIDFCQQYCTVEFLKKLGPSSNQYCLIETSCNPHTLHIGFTDAYHPVAMAFKLKFQNAQQRI